MMRYRPPYLCNVCFITSMDSSIANYGLKNVDTKITFDGWLPLTSSVFQCSEFPVEEDSEDEKVKYKLQSHHVARKMTETSSYRRPFLFHMTRSVPAPAGCDRPLSFLMFLPMMAV